MKCLTEKEKGYKIKMDLLYDFKTEQLLGGVGRWASSLNPDCSLMRLEGFDYISVLGCKQ